MKHSMAHTELDIIENLRDAGCDETEITSIMDCYRGGDRKRTEKLIAGCRKKQLERLHESQACIDRLDFLSYQLGKN